MGAITDSLAGKNHEERAAIKAEALTNKDIDLPKKLSIGGYKIKITSRKYKPKLRMLVIDFEAEDADGNQVDLNGPYQYYNPPVMVYTGMIPNPHYPGDDARGKPHPEQIRGYTEDPSKAIQGMFTDTVREVLKQRKKKGKS